jgi:hypothetical protein
MTLIHLTETDLSARWRRYAVSVNFHLMQKIGILTRKHYHYQTPAKQRTHYECGTENIGIAI